MATEPKTDNKGRVVQLIEALTYTQYAIGRDLAPRHSPEVYKRAGFSAKMIDDMEARYQAEKKEHHDALMKKWADDFRCDYGSYIKSSPKPFRYGQADKVLPPCRSERIYELLEEWAANPDEDDDTCKVMAELAYLFKEHFAETARKEWQGRS